MSLLVICMALVVLASQGSWPTGTILIFALVILFPAILVDLLIFIGISNPRYSDWQPCFEDGTGDDLGPSK